MLVSLHGVAAYACCLFAGWTPPGAMTERVDTGSNTGSNGTNAEFEINDLFIAASGAATGAQTATSIPSAVGLTKTITLRPPATARTCTITAAVKRQTPTCLLPCAAAAVGDGY